MDSRPTCGRRTHRAARLASLALVAGGLLTAGAAPAAAQERAAAPDSAKGPWTPPPLFEESGVLTLTVRTDLRSLIGDRDSTGRSYHDATVLLHGAGGRVDTMQARLRTRGHFRRQTRVCDFPPLRVDFRRGVRGTPFARQEDLKLVTRCQSRRDEYEQYLLQEYAVYRMLNALTPRSFRARLARITYEDTTRRHPGLTTYAFFVEPEKDMARRLGGTVLDAPNARLHDLDSAQTHLVSMFQYMVGNTDWSIPGLHNIVLVQATSPDSTTTSVFPVPYDFDWTGLVSARYAFPDARLPIRTVRERLFRGYCVRGQALRPAVEHIAARRAAVHAAVDSVPGLEPKARESARGYLDDYFRLVGDGGSLQRQIDVRCVPL